MIHAFALEPKLVATWGRREEFRFIHDKFGLGTPRVLLELPAFNKWKKRVYEAATELALSQQDMKRIEELFRLFGEHKCRRDDAEYEGLISWLENAEREYERRSFAGVVASENPRNHAGVLVADQLSEAEGGGTRPHLCEEPPIGDCYNPGPQRRPPLALKATSPGAYPIARLRNGQAL